MAVFDRVYLDPFEADLSQLGSSENFGGWANQYGIEEIFVARLDCGADRLCRAWVDDRGSQRGPASSRANERFVTAMVSGGMA